MRFFIFLAAAALLVGCASPAQRSARMQSEVDKMITIYGPACEKLGYKPDTDPWRDCILHLDAKDAYERGYAIPLY